MKTCSKCKQDKDYNDFYPQKTGRDGYRASCKQCEADRMKDPKYAESKKKYREENREITRDKAKTRYLASIGGVYKVKFKLTDEDRKRNKLEERRKWVAKNPERAKELNDISRLKYREDINAKISLHNTLGIPYKEVKNFPDLVELKKLQLAGMKESNALIKASAVLGKFCTKCKEDKPNSDFYKKKDMALGLSSWCKKCCTESNKNYYKNKQNGSQGIT